MYKKSKFETRNKKQQKLFLKFAYFLLLYRIFYVSSEKIETTKIPQGASKKTKNF